MAKGPRGTLPPPWTPKLTPPLLWRSLPPNSLPPCTTYSVGDNHHASSIEVTCDVTSTPPEDPHSKRDDLPSLNISPLTTTSPLPQTPKEINNTNEPFTGVSTSILSGLGAATAEPHSKLLAGSGIARKILNLPVQDRGKPHLTDSARSGVPCSGGEGRIQPCDRELGASCLVPIAPPMPTDGHSKPSIHAGGQQLDVSNTPNDAFFPNTILESIQNLAFTQWTPPKPSNRETHQRKRARVENPKSAAEIIRESNEELERLIASFGEQKDQAVVLEKLIVKEFKEFIREVILVNCPKDLSLCSLNLKSERGSSPADMALKLMIDLQRSPRVSKGKKPMDQSPTQAFPMNFIIWNVRGANNANFRRQCNAMVSLHKPSMLVLLETRMADHKGLTEDLNFDSQIQSAADGYSGGIVIMWKKDALNMEDITITPQSIHVMIQVPPEPIA